MALLLMAGWWWSAQSAQRQADGLGMFGDALFAFLLDARRVVDRQPRADRVGLDVVVLNHFGRVFRFHRNDDRRGEHIAFLAPEMACGDDQMHVKPVQPRRLQNARAQSDLGGCPRVETLEGQIDLLHLAIAALEPHLLDKQRPAHRRLV